MKAPAARGLSFFDEALKESEEGVGGTQRF